MNTKINYFELEQVDLQSLRGVLNNQLPKPNITKSRFTTKELTSTMRSAKLIVEIATKYFKRYGYRNKTLKPFNYYLELARYDCFPESKPIRIFDLHDDDYTTTGYQVNTIVFYLNKSPTFIGGNMLVNINNKDTTIPIQGGMAIIFEGSLLHMPTPCYGEGSRESIVFQIARLSSIN